MTSETPWLRLQDWLNEAEAREVSEPSAMSLASVDLDGMPSLRMVLLRGLDERGLVFYTNLISRKALDIENNPNVALCFHWKSLCRQVRIEGKASLVSAAEADAYFGGRPRESQIGAWASKQSRPLKSDEKLLRRVDKYTKAFSIGPVPRPDFWSGYRVVPEMFEFWQERPHRLHQRKLFQRSAAGEWVEEQLYP